MRPLSLRSPSSHLGRGGLGRLQACSSRVIKPAKQPSLSASGPPPIVHHHQIVLYQGTDRYVLIETSVCSC